MVPSRRRRVRGFTLMEIMLVLVLIGLAGAVIVPQGRSERAEFANAMTTLTLALNAAQQRAEQTGFPVGIAVAEQGWQRMLFPLAEQSDAAESWRVDGEHSLMLSDSFSLALSLEQQEIALPSAITPDATPQIWFYPGGEMSLFTLKLRQKRCEQAIASNGFMSFTLSEEKCDEPQTP
ncbi:Tfp pilus assembly protein FimT [Serratia quinivorans]|nr:Tfp pilus assembly protein FimT [Serratia quinivorans]CAI1063368.1 Tfp pilus assembly protein FimT [Serratia quinivorans]CAI1866278.1 Tfp pilus assembly protein FimT [Serratia quinivorans]CAI2120848.1 Tfp pilus assembly protein FimT [Serratia quinivorans]CAI2487041.1 Tfp pilus assembly protein FimT [Serratia quinivorans]